MQKKELCAVPAPVLDTYALTVCALLTAGCVSENTDFSLPVAQEGTTGSLSLSAMTLDVVADAEIVPLSLIHI